MNISRKRGARAALLAVPMLLAACGGGAPKPAQTAGPPAAPAIDVVRVVEQPLAGTISMPGELEAYETVAVFPRMN